MKKLLRPLHRQRQRRRTTSHVLNGKELAERFGVSIEHLEQFLDQQAIPFHKDSQGVLWASLSDTSD